MKLTKDQKSHARALHKKALVIDFHNDAIGATMPDSAYRASGGDVRELSEKSTQGHVDIPRLFEGGVDCQVFSHWVEPVYNQIAPQRMLQVLGYSFSEIEKNPELCLVTKYDEIIENDGKRISFIIGFEGGEAIMQDLRLLNIFYKLGLRRLTLTWNNRNMIADGASWQRSKGGLTEFGVKVVEECNKLGILIDVSHMTDQGFWDTLEISKNPVIASHSNCRVLCGHMRNLTDEMILALAEKEGVMGMNYFPYYLTDIDWKKTAADDIAEKNKAESVTVERVVDHIDHVAELLGNTDHIGLGSDYDGVPLIVKELEDVSKLPNLTEALIFRGYSDQEIMGILGGNWLRMIKRIW